MRKILTKVSTVILALLIGLSPLLNATTGMATEDTITSFSQDLNLSFTAASGTGAWATYNNAATPGVWWYTNTNDKGFVGYLQNTQYNDDWQILTTAVGFNVTELTGKVINSAVLQVYWTDKNDNGESTPTFSVYSISPPGSSATWVNTDWNVSKVSGSACSAAVSYSAITAASWYNITITDLDAVMPDENGFAYFGFACNNNVANTMPDHDEDYEQKRIAFRKSSIYPETGPFLRVNYENVLSPSVTTLAATNETYNGATLHGNLTDMGSADVVGVGFQTGLSEGVYSKTWHSSPYNLTETGVFNVTATDLISNTTYHYRAFGIALVGGSYVFSVGSDMTFVTLPLTITPTPSPTVTSPSVTTGTVVHLSNTTATIYGELISKGTATNVTVGFDFGTGSPTEYYFDAYQSPMNTTGIFYLTLSNLEVGTTYWYRAVATGDAVTLGEFVTFQNYNFRLPNSIDPVIATEPAIPVGGGYNSILVGNLTLVGDVSPVNCTFQVKRLHATEWATLWQNPLDVRNSTGSYDVTITTIPNAWYEYRAMATNGRIMADGQIATYGDIKIFQAGNEATPTPFTINLNPASNVGSTTATISALIMGTGITNTTTIYYFFQYGIYALGNEYLSTTTETSRIGTGTISTSLTSLTPATKYKFIAYAIVENGTGDASGWLYFTTLNADSSTPTPTPTGIPPTTPPPTGTSTPNPLVPDTSTPEGRWLTVIYLMVAAPLILTICLHRTPLIATTLSVAVDVLILGWGIINWLATTSTFTVLLVVLGLVAAFAIFTFIGLRRGSG